MTKAMNGTKGERPQVGIAKQRTNNKVGTELFDKWNDELGRIQATGLHRDQHDRNQNAGDNLQRSLLRPVKPKFRRWTIFR